MNEGPAGWETPFLCRLWIWKTTGPKESKNREFEVRYFYIKKKKLIEKVKLVRLHICLETTALSVRGTAAAAAAAASVIWCSNMGRALAFKMVWIW